MLDFAKLLIFHSDMDSGHQRVAAVTFSSDVKVGFHLKDHNSRAGAYWAMDGLQYHPGSTNMMNMLRTLREDVFSSANGDHPEASNVAVILTDAEFNVRRDKLVREAMLLRSAGTHVYVISIGVADSSALASIATPPAEQNIFSLDRFSDLTGTLREQLKLCNTKTAHTGTGKDSMTTPLFGGVQR